MEIYLRNFIIIVVGSSALIGCSSGYEEIKTKHKELIINYGLTQFEKGKWKVSNPTHRGEMIKSLFLKHKFMGKNVSYVKDLLGQRDCYIDYEHAPCYELIYEGYYYYLVFGIGHPSSEDNDVRNKVITIELFERG